MGSQKRYLKEFQQAKGAYWLNSGWIENCTALFDREDLRRRKWIQYAEEFGEENADYLMEMEESWESNYSSLGYIHSQVYDDPENLCKAEKEALKKNWTLREIDDDLRMMRMMVSGTWNEEEFLILQKGEIVIPDYSGLKIKAALQE